MNYNQLISLAENKAKIAVETIKKPKAKTTGPDPKAIEKFLIEKRLKEIREEEEKRAKLEKLLSLRRQNSKSNKKAKLMANRTKDNDYSKIVLTDRDIQNKERIDAELRKKGIDDKLVRMKERIELDHELEDQPIKRKRKIISSDVKDTNNTEINYSYDKIKKNREEIFKKPDQSKQPAKPQQSKSSGRPPSYEELLKIAQQQREKKKTLEQEIEEMAVKKTKNEKEELRKKEELYQKSLISLKKKKKSDTESIQPSSSKHDTHERSDHYNSQMKVCPTSTKSIPKKQPSDSGSFRKEKSVHSQSSNTRKDDLPPISQVLKRPPKNTDRESSNGLEQVLNDKLSGGNLASRIANLSKEELLELANAVKKVKKSKKNTDEEYSPQTCHSYDEYRPSNYQPSKISSSSFKSNNEPVYVPTKIKQHQTDRRQEEYCPITNYKSSNCDQKKQTPQPAPRKNNKLFDIDSLTPEEIEKIRQERMAKQRKEEEEARLSNERSKSSKPIKRSSPPYERESNRPSTSRINGLPSRDSGASRESNYPLSRRPYQSNEYLPPIGKNYRRGDYDTSYNDYDEEYDEEDDDMSDFIDDGNDFGTQEDVSRAIEELFPKYKKRKYQIFDDDSDIEESSYAQQMREELHSSRIGLLEDLAEERREQEEIKRKRRKGIISSDEDD